MKEIDKGQMGETVVPILILGAIWGIFEATVGYLLHLLPISIGFLVWYPVAVFFLMAAYQVTGRKTAVLATAALAAAVKLLNLLLPGRIDRVINPAASILFEGIAVFTSVYIGERLTRTPKPMNMLLNAMGTNTLWRVVYLGYLAFLVPDWIREASVLKSGGELLRFIVIDNILSSLIVFAGMLSAQWLKNHRLNPISHSCRKGNGFTHALLATLLLALNITLQMIL